MSPGAGGIAAIRVVMVLAVIGLLVIGRRLRG
jgi:hypothetical protein